MRKIILILIIISVFTNCDPALSGDLKVFNDCSQVISVKYMSNKDTAYADIQPNSYIVVRVLGGLGKNWTFDCCPCYSTIVSIKNGSTTLKKDITNSDNWDIPNKKALKKRRLFKQEKVKCELHITDNDF